MCIRDSLEALPLWDFGGGMVAEVGPDCSTYGAIPQRLEAGTPHYVGAISLGAALNYLEREDVAEIAAYETKPVSYTHLDVYKRQVKLCNKCRRRSATTCKTYPNGIPKKILIGNDCPDYEPKESGAGR